MNINHMLIRALSSCNYAIICPPQPEPPLPDICNIFIKYHENIKYTLPDKSKNIHPFYRKLNKYKRY